MAITIVGTATGHILSSTEDFDITLPSMQEGDVVVVATGGASSYWTPEVLTTGYTEVSNLGTGSTSYANLVVAWKRMGATPDSIVTCLGTGSATKDAMGIAYVLRGVDATTVMDVSPTEYYLANSLLLNPAAITPVTQDALIVICGSVTIAGTFGSDSSVDPPSGYSNQALIASDASAAQDATLIVASKLWSGSGEEDPDSWVIDGDTSFGSASLATTLAIRPAVIPDTNAALTITGQQSNIMTTIDTSPGSLAITGSSSGITADVPFDFSVNLPDLQGSSLLDDSFTIIGNIPELHGSFEFGIEVSFDSDLPNLTGALDFGLQVDSDLPDMQGSMIVAVPFGISGSLPYLTGSMDFGMAAVGGLPNLEGAANIPAGLIVSGSLSDLSAEMDFGLVTEGQLVNLTGSANVSSVLGIDSLLPSVDGSMDLGLRIEGTLYSLEGSADVTTLFEISNSLPELSGSAEFGFVADSGLPDLGASMDLDQRYDFEVTLPSLDGSLELSSIFDIVGTLPEVSGSMVLDTYDYYDISGNLPQLSGSFLFENADSFIAEGKLPALGGLAELEIEQTMVIDGSLPPLDLSLFSFSDIAFIDLSESFTPTTDGIIRHRRGYDNG